MKLPFKSKPNFWRTYAAITLTGLGVTFFAYIAVQQDLRLSANNVPTQDVIDTEIMLSNGTSPIDAVGIDKQYVGASYSPIKTIYDESHLMLATSGTGKFAGSSLPTGVFDFAKAHGVDKITWSHDGGRYATVVSYNSSTHYFTVVSQSLKPVEENIDSITTLFLLTCIGVVLAPALLLLSL